MRTNRWLSVFVVATLASAGFAFPSSANTGYSPRIIGGGVADISEAPWQVALVSNSRNNTNSQDQFCGGSLIHAQWVLTAAHCLVDDSNRVTRANRLAVLAGVSVLSDDRVGRVSVSNVYVHPGYRDPEYEDDVALLKLSRPVTLVPGTVELVSLPFQKSPSSWPSSGTSALVSGWGWTGTEYPDELKAATIEIVSDPLSSDCGDYSPAEYLAASMLCAGDIPAYAEDTCWGDSGGPLVISDGEQNLLAGITSWGNGCAEDGYPGVYARVTTYLDWIAGYVSFPGPKFSSVNPSRAAVGTLVSIRGTGLDLVESVSFGDVSADFDIISPTEVSATVPIGAVTSKIRLYGESGMSVSRANFSVVLPLPTITRLSPVRTSVGSVVVVTGTNLLTVQSVYVGSIEAELVEGTVTQTSLSFVVPAGASRNRVTITTDFGTTISRSLLGIR